MKKGFKRRFGAIWERLTLGIFHDAKPHERLASLFRCYATRTTTLDQLAGWMGVDAAKKAGRLLVNLPGLWK